MIQGMSDISKKIKLSRLEKLKAKRLEAKKLNQKALIEDQKRQKLLSIKSKKAEQEGLNGEFHDSKSEKQSRSVLDYTLEEVEKWNEKQLKITKNNNRDGLVNQDKLAELTYYKELKEFKIDKEAYEKQKLDLMNKYNVNESELKHIVDLSNNPDAKTKDELSKLLSQFKENKTNKRRYKTDDDLETGGYINEKNKQFNMKLNRQYS
ncbi:unnamed protein product [Candida verbasci]|uniref:Pre-mRNA-splicing factor SYF2 n=1 Tax=Candida verbasci TaxID=1227364 RepID=A0A9W4U1H1_9ASCO|nr:unnamed protein product [Candida verbasci]